MEEMRVRTMTEWIETDKRVSGLPEKKAIAVDGWTVGQVYDFLDGLYRLAKSRVETHGEPAEALKRLLIQWLDAVKDAEPATGDDARRAGAAFMEGRWAEFERLMVEVELSPFAPVLEGSELVAHIRQMSWVQAETAVTGNPATEPKQFSIDDMFAEEEKAA